LSKELIGRVLLMVSGKEYVIDELGIPPTQIPADELHAGEVGYLWAHQLRQ
jgi:GTP-binding protein LepA